MRRTQAEDGKRDRESSPVKCPAQNRTYSLTFHQIDKSNQKEAKYDLGGQSKTHNWSPKLVFRLFNMNNANAHAYYKRLAGTTRAPSLGVPPFMPRLLRSGV